MAPVETVVQLARTAASSPVMLQENVHSYKYTKWNYLSTFKVRDARAPGPARAMISGRGDGSHDRDTILFLRRVGVR